MDNNYWIGPVFLAAVVSLGGTFLMGSSVGYDNGLNVGKRYSVIQCTEKPKDCKIVYDYLKLQKAQ